MCVSHRRALLAAVFATVKNAYVLTLADQGGSTLPAQHWQRGPAKH